MKPQRRLETIKKAVGKTIMGEWLTSQLTRADYLFMVERIEQLQTVLAEMAAAAPRVSEEVAIVKYYVLHKCINALNSGPESK